MTGRIALCVDEAAYHSPGLIGLDGESLETQDWLDVYHRGDEARKAIAESDVDEAWVVSCDDVDPINLAAALKGDHPGLPVALVSFDGCGSLFSRAHTASIDRVLERSGFARTYAAAKGRAAESESIPAGTARHARGNGVHVPDVDAALPAPWPAPLPISTTQDEAPPALQREPRPRTEARTEVLPARVLPAPASDCFVLPVVSGSGGAGKSAVATTCAFLAADMGYRVLLIDYDLQFGDVALLAGAADALAVDVALAHPERLDQDLARNLNPTVLAAPARLESADGAARDLPGLLDRVSGNFDLVVANTGAAWADHHAALLERSSGALFLVDQRASSVWACRHALELCARCGIATGPFQFALNRCRKGAPLSTLDVSNALDGAIVHEIGDGGPEVEECLGSGNARELVDANGPFCTSLRQVLRQMLPDGELRNPAPATRADARRNSRKRGRRADRRKGRER